jgi:hypothetical protein
MSFPVVTSSGGQFGTGLLYSNVFYFVAGRVSQVYSFTVPAGITTIRARCWGGGGGGSYSSSGGGGGGFAIKTVTGLTPGSTITITAGAGGDVDASGSTSSFGSHVSATGGLFGNGGRTGGSGVGGDKNSNGQGGTSSTYSGGFYGAYAGNYFVSYTPTGTDANRNLIGISFLPSSPANQLDLIGTAGVFNNASTSGGRGGQVLGQSNTTQAVGNAPGGGGCTNTDNNGQPGGGGLVIVEY